MRFLLRLAYNGAAYHGWQIQAGNATLPTIQSAVETALFKLCGEEIRVYGAGRTDAGVHAYGQAAHFDGPERDWRRQLNALLPSDIRVQSVEPVTREFHACKSAIAKTYIYQFWLDPHFISPFIAPFAWNCGPLNLEAMTTALAGFLGEHDFASFQNAGTPVKTTSRRILDAKLELLPLLEVNFAGTSLVRLKITGNGFLKQMVRNIAGFLAAAGKGSLNGDDLEEILEARDRRALPCATAPAQGLFLDKVHYDGEPLHAELQFS